MSALRKKIPYQYPNNSRAENQASIQKTKIESEALSQKLSKSIIDNPKTAQKAAILISLWLEGKTAKRKKSKP